MVWLVLAIIGVAGILILIAFMSVYNEASKATKIKCPSCNKETLFKADHDKWCHCRWCKTLIIEDADTYRAHTPKVDAS